MNAAETIERVTPPAEGRRGRILSEAIALFAARGYERVSVGEIEEAAGLVPRRGALYRHFPSKRALLETALAERLAAIDELAMRIAELPVGELRGELRLVAEFGLEELERERDLARIVMKDGDSFPEIAAAFHAAVVARGHRLARDWLDQRAALYGRMPADPDAVAQVLVDSLVGFKLQQFMFGEGFAPIARDRFVASWVDAAAGLVRGGETEDEG